MATTGNAKAAPAGWQRVVTDLVAERGDALTRYAYLLTGSADDAADLVQDALVHTFGRLRNGFTVTSAEAYVRRAILNGYLDGGRRTTRWRKIVHLEAVPELTESSAPGTDSRIDLQGELKKLAPRERACLVLRYYDDLKVDDIAVDLGISAGAVKRYLSDGLAKMAVALGPDGTDVDLDLDPRTPAARKSALTNPAPSHPAPPNPQEGVHHAERI
ncbi:MAG: SigE family polymerase sigma factor [Microbacteriaceae bacterium]|nr:SigE family polymerase sigma factor [Microbacteriaceae bacterium]